MKIKDFDIEQYVKKRILNGKNEEDLLQQEYDKYLDNKESEKKNVENVLKNFYCNQRVERFLFENNVLEYFPLEAFDSKDISRFLNHIFELKNEEKFIGNKLVYNLSKISIDNIDKKIQSKEREYEFFYMEKPLKNELSKQLKILKFENRMIIRKQPQCVKNLMEKNISELEIIKKEKVISNLNYVVEYVSDIFLQILNYWVITIPNSSYNQKMNTINRIEDYLDKYKKHVIKSKRDVKVDIKLEDAVTVFISFLINRNEFGDYISILKILEEEQKYDADFFEVPKDECRVKKGDIVDKKQEKSIITEGCYVDSFTDKLKKTKEIIHVFSEYGGRKANVNDILDMKVYFREIYLSDSKYKRQAKTIVHKYLKCIEKKKELGCSIQEIIKSFEKESEYRFLREKISRGYFRETCDIRLYAIKNKVQKKLYEALLDTLLIYDYTTSIQYLQEIIRELVPICFELIDSIIEDNYGYRIF